MSHKISLVSSSLLVVFMIFFACYVNILVAEPVTKDNDIYYSYIEGQRLINGENPYARILEGDMRKNQKYASYFPVFYELSYLSQLSGLRSFDDWMPFWQIVFMIFEFSTAVLLYLALARRNLEWIGVFGSAFWLFNRWTLYIIRTANMDFIPIFFLILSLELFPRQKWLSLLLFGLSLGFKQIGIFLAPLYLIWIFHLSGKDWLKQVLKSGAVMAGIPFLSALPFLIWNAQGFINSILFSATRDTAGQFFPPSLDVVIHLDGILARIVMLTLMALLYLFAFKGHGKKYIIAFVVMLVFIYFNTILFAQYEVWVVAFIPLFFSDLHTQESSRLEIQSSTL